MDIVVKHHECQRRPPLYPSGGRTMSAVPIRDMLYGSSLTIFSGSTIQQHSLLALVMSRSVLVKGLVRSDA